MKITQKIKIRFKIQKPQQLVMISPDAQSIKDALSLTLYGRLKITG